MMYRLVIITAFLFLLASCWWARDDESEKRIDFDKPLYSGTGDIAMITVRDNFENTDPGRRESIEAYIYSTESDPAGETFTLNETKVNSGVFSGEIGFERIFSNAGYIGPISDNGLLGVAADGFIGAREHIIAEYITAMDELFMAETDYEETSSTVSGVVKDQMGEIVPGASVHLYNANLSYDVIVGSRSDGVYAIYDVPSGIYTIEVDKDSYRLQQKLVIVP
jgi:hypothetical protein